MIFISNCCRRSKNSTTSDIKTSSQKELTEAEKKASEALKAFLAREEEIDKKWERYHRVPPQIKYQTDENVDDNKIKEGNNRFKIISGIFFALLGILAGNKLSKLGEAAGKSSLTGIKEVGTSSEAFDFFSSF